MVPIGPFWSGRLPLLGFEFLYAETGRGQAEPSFFWLEDCALIHRVDRRPLFRRPPKPLMEACLKDMAAFGAGGCPVQPGHFSLGSNSTHGSRTLWRTLLWGVICGLRLYL